jgi:hypothetical protein
MIEVLQITAASPHDLCPAAFARNFSVDDYGCGKMVRKILSQGDWY